MADGLNSLTNKGLGGLGPIQPNGRDSIVPSREEASGFKEALKRLTDNASTDGLQKKSALSFSQHAVERMRQRGVSLNQQAMERIEQAVERAASKGSKQSLVLTEDSAVIVNPKEKKVITVMDRELMKENVFTNIDSTVLA